jgi:hypothetical protein
MLDDEDFPLISRHKWYKSAKGYAMLSNRNDISMHRLILGCTMKTQTDHANQNKLDNQKSNLTYCSYVENSRNKKKMRGLASQYKGVCDSRNTSIPFRAYITKDKRQVPLGGFNTEEDAARAYDKAALATFGKFAWTNFDKYGYSEEDILEGQKSVEAFFQRMEDKKKSREGIPKHVYYDRGAWVAIINGKHYLGRHETKEEAGAAVEAFLSREAVV